MINKLVIHLGDTKTGSTSIQNALVRGLCHIPGQTLVYPTANNHVAMARTLTQKRRFSQREDRFRRVGAALDASDADIGIVSAEHFQFVDPQVLAETIDAYWPQFRDRLHLIAYVRPHADKLVSTFAERIKLGSKLTDIEAFFASDNATQVFDYTTRFGRWREVFGDQFTLRPFVRSELSQGDAIHDFLRTFLGHENFRITGDVSANTSLNIGQLALLREVHGVINSRFSVPVAPRILEARGAVGRLAAEYMRNHPLAHDSAKLAIPAKLAGPIRERYGADAEALDSAFFDGTPMSDSLASLERKLVDTPQSLEARDHVSQDAIETARILGNVLADLLERDPDGIRKTIGQSRSGVKPGGKKTKTKGKK